MYLSSLSLVPSRAGVYTCVCVPACACSACACARVRAAPACACVRGRELTEQVGQTHGRDIAGWRDHPRVGATARVFGRWSDDIRAGTSQLAVTKHGGPDRFLDPSEHVETARCATGGQSGRQFRVTRSPAPVGVGIVVVPSNDVTARLTQDDRQTGRCPDRARSTRWTRVPAAVPIAT